MRLWAAKGGVCAAGWARTREAIAKRENDIVPARTNHERPQTLVNTPGASSPRFQA